MTDSSKSIMISCINSGFSVFPVCQAIAPGRCMHHGKCKNPGKQPLVPWLEFQHNLPTEEDVKNWYDKLGEVNIGLVTGSLSGVVVLDADSEFARKYAEDNGVPSGPRVHTGKPGGMHYWLKHPGREVKNFVGKVPGLDFRGDGGFVLVPPSVHVSGLRYRWADDIESWDLPEIPEWISNLLEKNTHIGAYDTQKHENGWIAKSLEELKSGNRNQTLHSIAGWLRRYGASVDDIIALLKPHAMHAGLDMFELENLVRSAGRYRIENGIKSEDVVLVIEGDEMKWVKRA